MAISERESAAFISFRTRIKRAAASAPDKLALCDDQASLTFRALEERLGAFERFLGDRAVRAGDAIAICALNSLDYGFVYLAAVSNGVVVAPLPQGATIQSLSAMIRDCGARIVFADSENLARLREAMVEADLLPLEGLALSLRPQPQAVQPEIDPAGIFNIIYSSGTTGTPKGIVQSNAMRHAHVELAIACGYGAETVTMISTPLYSNTTLVSFLPTIALGGTAIIMRRFDAEHFLRSSQLYKATHAMLVPVQYRRLLAFPGFETYDLSAYREKFCTSAPFSADLKSEVLQRWPGGLTEYYGMTEGGGLAILFAHLHPDKLHTVGQPAPDNDIRVVDDDDREVPRGYSGEIVGRSRGMMMGYHNLPDATAAAYWFSPEGERFMRTGDVGRFDEDGFLILMDRKKDVIISGGFNIYPSDLEEVMRCHQSVEDVAVIGVQSEQWGETPVAFVVAPSVEPAELRDFANSRLGKLQRLSDVRIVERLPRSDIGKVLKRALRDAYAGESKD